MADYWTRPVRRHGGRDAAGYGNTRLNAAPPKPRRRPPFARYAKAFALILLGAGFYHIALSLFG